MSKKLFFLGLLVAILLVACEPSDSEATELISEHWGSMGIRVRNINITGKGQCDQISTSAKASGVSEAWIIKYSLERTGYQSAEWRSSKNQIVLVLIDGSWQKSGNDLVCP